MSELPLLHIPHRERCFLGLQQLCPSGNSRVWVLDGTGAAREPAAAGRRDPLLASSLRKPISTDKALTDEGPTRKVCFQLNVLTKKIKS